MDNNQKRNAEGIVLAIGEVALVSIDDNDVFTFIGNKRGEPVITELKIDRGEKK